VAMQREPVVIEDLLEVLTPATHHVVDANHRVAVGDQPVTEVAAEESAGTRNYDVTHLLNLPHLYQLIWGRRQLMHVWFNDNSSSTKRCVYDHSSFLPVLILTAFCMVVCWSVVDNQVINQLFQSIIPAVSDTTQSFAAAPLQAVPKG